MILKAALIIGYTACFFLWGFAIIVLSVGLGVPLIRTSYGLIFIAVGLLILILGLLHIYNYFRQGNATKQILNLLKARGSPLHIQIRRARIRRKR